MYLPSTGELIRFAVATEDSAPPPPPGAGGDDDPVRAVRLKTRHTFVHKHEVAYDLTEVRSGRSQPEAAGSAPEFEVELEWVGSHAPPPPAPGAPPPPPPAASYPPDLCARKFVFKVADLVALHRAAAAGAGGAPGPHGGYGGGGGGYAPPPQQQYHQHQYHAGGGGGYR